MKKKVFRKIREFSDKILGEEETNKIIDKTIKETVKEFKEETKTETKKKEIKKREDK